MLAVVKVFPKKKKKNFLQSKYHFFFFFLNDICHIEINIQKRENLKEKFF